MKTRHVILIIIAAVIVIIVLRKMYNAMLLTKLVPFILESEGGLSRDPADTAAKNPAPWTYKGQTGWHTNKGVTYTTFISNASRLGYAPTAENFFKMPNEIFLKILRGVYVSSYPLTRIDNLPRIQAVIITWAWGSGPAGSEKLLANFQREVMGIKDGNITRSEIVDNFKKHVNLLNEREMFNKLCDRRAADFKKMQTFSVHGKGWLNRLAKFRQLFS